MPKPTATSPETKGLSATEDSAIVEVTASPIGKPTAAKALENLPSNAVIIRAKNITQAAYEFINERLYEKDDYKNASKSDLQAIYQRAVGDIETRDKLGSLIDGFKNYVDALPEPVVIATHRPGAGI